MSQYSLKHAAAKFGSEGEKVAFKKLDQLHYRSVFNPIISKKESIEEHAKVLECYYPLIMQSSPIPRDVHCIFAPVFKYHNSLCKTPIQIPSYSLFSCPYQENLT
jgi:hypothetical protein